MSSMVFTGTATNHVDLQQKVIDHLTGAGMGSQAWTLLRDNSGSGFRDTYLRGPGLSGTDEIYVQIESFQNISNDSFGFYIAGTVAMNPLNPWSTQPGKSPNVVMPLWDSLIPYWLIANGRRFILIAKVSTVYTSCYCGFIMPYATSAEMPYPLAIMANCNTTNRWSIGSWQISGFWDPVMNSSFLRYWDGAWVSIANFNARTDYRETNVNNQVWPFHIDCILGTNRNGNYGILPAIIHGNWSGENVFGELEGVYQVAGYSNAAEDIITIGSDEYLVVQSAYRTTNRDYAAIKLG